jgi:hypothetical protein
MISAAAVPKVSSAGRTTPTDFLLPSASVRLWLTHLPSKYTLAWVLTLTLAMWEVLMVLAVGSAARPRAGAEFKGGAPAQRWRASLANQAF